MSHGNRWSGLRKRGDSNPRSLAGRSLSRCSVGSPSGARVLVNGSGAVHSRPARHRRVVVSVDVSSQPVSWSRRHLVPSLPLVSPTSCMVRRASGRAGSSRTAGRWAAAATGPGAVRHRREAGRGPRRCLPTGYRRRCMGPGAPGRIGRAGPRLAAAGGRGEVGQPCVQCDAHRVRTPAPPRRNVVSRAVPDRANGASAPVSVLADEAVGRQGLAPCRPAQSACRRTTGHDRPRRWGLPGGGVLLRREHPYFGSPLPQPGTLATSTDGSH